MQLPLMLTVIEQTELEANETVIEHGLQTFVDVGNALMAIRDGKLYRQSHGTFEDYCEERWHFTPQYANRLIGAAGVIQNLETLVSKLPDNESHTRPLTALPPEIQAQAWQEAVDTAPDGKITRNHVASVVEQYKPQAAQEDVPDAEVIEPETSGRQKPKTNRAGDQYVPQGFDACQTPSYAIDPLLPYLNPDWLIWEPASGEGLLVEALYNSGFESVLVSDLLTGQNFFDYDPGNWDCLITNPPYSIKYPWLERCYTLGKPFALLVPVETLGAKTAQALLKEHGFEIMLLDQRVDFGMPNKGFEGSAQFPVLWLCWNILPQQIMFGSIEAGKRAFNG